MKAKQLWHVVNAATGERASVPTQNKQQAVADAKALNGTPRCVNFEVRPA